MINDPLLEWIKKVIMEWVLINPKSFKYFINNIPISYNQREIISSYFIPSIKRTQNFKEIEFNLNKSHDYVMREYKKSLKIILDNIPSYIFKHFPTN